MRAVDLFAGCGGLSKGFQGAGVKIIAAFENWDQAIECYQINFRHSIIKQDLSDITDTVRKIKKFKPDLIIGGPPCQDFSHAGKRNEKNMAELTGSFAKIISLVKPSYFVMENVDRSSGSRAYSKARKIFKSSGYGITETVLDASRCGVPQNRKRFFCIGALGENDGFLLEHLERGLSSKPITIRDYLGNDLGLEFYYRHPRNYNRRGIFSIDEPSPTVRGVNRPIPKGYPGHHNDAAPKNTPSLRPLSTMERARLQTFPKGFKWVGSKTDLEQMIGNAVPVKLAEYVGKALWGYVCEKKKTKKVVA